MSTKSKQIKHITNHKKIEKPIESPVQIKTEFNIETPIISEPQATDLFSEQLVVASTTPVEAQKISYEYKIIVARNDLDMFQLNVTEHLNNGWELSGGVSCSMYTDSYSASTIWSQAVYKKNLINS